MIRHARFSTLATLALGLTLHAANTRADTFNWNTVTYAPTPAVAATKTQVGTSTGGNAVSVQFTLGTGATFSTAVQSPRSASNSDNTTYYTDGGGSTTQRSLQIVTDFTSSTAAITVSLFFAQPVTNASFTFFDVDSGTVGGGGYNDQIRAITGISSADGSSVAPASLANIGTGATNTVNSVSQVTANASSSAASTSNAGNVTATFGATPINEITFVYGDTYTAGAHSTVQLIALSNLTFTVVPEPGTLTVLGLGAAGLGMVAMLRRRR